MNWQLISFFGDSTVLLPSAAALFIVLMLRKTSRLLAWQWSLLFGITGAIVCASKLAFMGWGLGTGLYRLQWPLRALRGLLAYLPVAAQRPFFRGFAKSSCRHRLYSGRCGGVFTAGHPCAFRLGSDCRPAAGRCWQRFVPGVAKTYLCSGKREYLMGRCCMPGDGPSYPVT